MAFTAPTSTKLTLVLHVFGYQFSRCYEITEDQRDGRGLTALRHLLFFVQNALKATQNIICT